MTNKAPHPFFSLKWKAGLLFGLVLILFNALFPTLVYWNLQQQFELSRKQIQQQFQLELTGQLQNTSNELQRLAEISLIPENASSQSIINALNKHRSKLELDWQITHAQLFDKQSIKLGGWGDSLPTTISNVIPNVLTTESATNIMDCNQGCKQYDFIPILIKGQTLYVMLLAYDLSDTLLDFTNNTAADVAILSANHTQKNHNSERHLSNWNMNISALTSYQDNVSYLQQFANNYSLDVVRNQDKIIRDQNLPVEFYFVPVTNSNGIFFLIIDSIAVQQKDIMAITYRSIYVALLNVLLLGGGLFYFLSKPLSRLSEVSRVLPLLAKQKYSEVKALVSPETSHHTVDELDILENSTHKLTLQLEQLHQSVKERTSALHTRSSELQQERDFVKSLIDTAQLIILTIDRQCNITSFNDYGEQVTGYLETDIINTPLKRLFPSGQWSDIESMLIELKKIPNSVNQQQSEFIHSDGSIRTISWLHSSLSHPSESTVVLSVGLDITEQKRTEEQIIWLADHDVLTDLYNRRKFNIEFERILEQAKRFKHEGALLYLDLDQFKDINDSCGHKEGDQVLKQVAHIIQSITRTTDIISRLGGDEFAIIIPETDTLGAITLAEKLTESLAEMNVIFDDIRYKITASIGVVKFPLADLTVEELMSNADLAMYQAKSRGKNTWHQFNLDGKIRHQLETRVLWKQRIEDALENHRFIFYYQPIMDIQTQTVSHYETLIRMQGQDGSIYPPATFIEVAEQTGLINEIDHLVLQEGIFKQAELDKTNSGISLSLNLSGYAVDDKLLLPLMNRLLDDSKVNPNNLIFELTETAAVADVTQAKKFMTELNKLGCRFSLDDFGTGFASFRYMRELPVDIVKIDGSFVTDLAHNPDDQLFVKALVDVAKGMGKKTIAEFVENAETLELLNVFGVDYAQGYYIGKPEPEFLQGPPDLK